MVKINLWIEDDVLVSVIDQVSFMSRLFEQLNFEFRTSNTLDPLATNICIENFNATTNRRLREFNEKHKKRVGIILTEHIDMHPFDGVKVYGRSLSENNDYIDRNTIQRRLTFLFDALEYSFGVFTLGDEPELQNFEIMVPGLQKFIFPYPRLYPQKTNSRKVNKSSKFLFSGTKTKYREQVLKKLETAGLNVTNNFKLLPENERKQLLDVHDCMLNIPQFNDWKWISPMRVMAGLDAGLPSLSIGTSDTTSISKVVPQVSIEKFTEDVENIPATLSFARQLKLFNKIAIDEKNTSILLNIFETLHFVD